MKNTNYSTSLVVINIYNSLWFIFPFSHHIPYFNSKESIFVMINFDIRPILP